MGGIPSSPGAEFISGNIKTFYHFSTWRCCSLLKFLLMNDEDKLSSHVQYHCCWCPGSLCRQLISSYCIMWAIWVLILHVGGFQLPTPPLCREHANIFFVFLPINLALKWLTVDFPHRGSGVHFNYFFLSSIFKLNGNFILPSAKLEYSDCCKILHMTLLLLWNVQNFVRSDQH